MTAPPSNTLFASRAHDLKDRLPVLCTALSGLGMFDRARELSREFSFFEFRFDTLTDPSTGMDELGAFLEAQPNALAVATCRRKENGGHFTGTAEQEAKHLLRASESGAQILDLSIESAEELSATGAATLNALRRCPAALLLSWHDFAGTPDLLEIYRRMQLLQPDFYKIVPTARNLRDSIALLELLKQHGGARDLIAMSMGIPGILTRVLGPRYGSRFTFGSPEEGSETAPGQISSRTLRDLYRLPHIGEQTKIYGVFGKPISGSKSPVMLNTAFHEADEDAVYLPLEAEDADDLFACVEGLSLAGASVTMPLKEQILARLAQMSSLARQLGAANTLVRRNGELAGDNTDAAGILVPLEKRIVLQSARVLVLGAGGAARAAAYALRSRGSHVFLCNRTHTKAEELARLTGGIALTREQLAAETFDVVLNATPYGMKNQNIGAPIQEREMNCRFFFDMVYNPVETPLVRMARSKGIAIIPGTEMFVTQGAAQFELWTSKPAPVDAMRDAVLASLKPAP